MVILSFAIPEGERSSALSPVESEVVAHVLKGHSNSEIARLITRYFGAHRGQTRSPASSGSWGCGPASKLVAHAAIAQAQEK